MKEIWKDIKDYEGLYQVSNNGKVKSLSRYVKGKSNSNKLLPEIILKEQDNKGYKYIMLCINNTMKVAKIHRLVALAFIPNPDNKPEVNHKDGNKSNNNDWNLEWNTSSENHQHAYDTCLRIDKGEDNYYSKLINEEVIEIRTLYKTGLYTQRALAKMFNVSKSNINNIVLNKTYKL